MMMTTAMIVRPLRWRSIDPSPGYVGCLVTKNTHRCSYDALACRHGLPAGREPFPTGGTLDGRWMEVGWMDVYDVAYVGG